MISIIICSRGNDIPTLLRDNIVSTIGCDFELVIIDNSTNRYNIFQAYNEGVRRAKGEILCFAHDDILFHDNTWGPVVERHFEETPEMGLMGVAGSHFLSSHPIYWSACPVISEHHLHNDHGQIIHCFHEDYFPKGSSLSEVVAVDGLCFFMRKELFQQIHFDEETYHGFHAYDLDICMQVQALGMKVMVCRDVLVEHAWSESTSKKKPGMELLSVNLRLFVRKWEKMLPITRGVDIPPHTIFKINQLCEYAYDATQVRTSKAYRIGRALLSPIKFIQKIAKRR